MDQTRLILLIALSFVSLMLWEAWQRDYGPAPAPAAVEETPGVRANDMPAVAAASAPAPEVLPDQAIASASPISAAPITVKTDLLSLVINPTGGVIEQAELRAYPEDSENPDESFKLLDTSAQRYFIHQSGLKAGIAASADHYATYFSASARYELAAADDTLTVTLTWRSPEGVEVDKQYILRRGSYVVELAHKIRNNSGADWTYHHYDQLQRKFIDTTQYFIHTFTGAAVSTPEKRYEKFTFEDLTEEPVKLSSSNGWAAILEHYFVGAIVPAKDLSYQYYSSIVSEESYVIGYYGPASTVQPGATAETTSRIFLGPKLQKTLAEVAPGLELTVDYGMLWFIGKILFWILDQWHGLTGNWGWSIILLTIAVKLMFYPLSAAGYRSMAKMRKVQPRLVALRERHQNDRAALNQAMMDLYRNEKINPLGGCLPILIQIPVFIALYWVILESVELRQAPWTLWITDLSIKDPFFVLPVLMTLSMWLQTKLNPAPVDPIQARVMQIMPFAFGAFFAFFPSGLVLYWFVNNCLSIAQQWTVTRAEERKA
ncbi:MAG: membrane protein insertase YidC [Gammaproteobacteria bacterium]|nr:membrane protein insertase YidC [Gammaproteobacteria bacterium]